MITTTLYKIIQSELIKKGFDEFIDDEGQLVLFDEEHQFMTKILKYDDDVSEIVDHLFYGQSLKDPEFDEHFKKGFIYRFINRQINRQTIESFKLELLSTFLSNNDYINRVYRDMDKFLLRTSITDQQNKQNNNGSNITDNRSAFADLPQNNVQIDVDNTIMESASDNTISRNKQTSQQETDGETNIENKIYQLDELFKTNGLMEQVYNKFDIKCFLQVW